MKAIFKIKITVNDMYRFLMSHTYHTFSGGFSIFGSLVMLGIMGYSIYIGQSTATTNLLYPILAIIFLLYQPFTLASAAVKQTKLNPVFKEPIEYDVSEEGIMISQNAASDEITWDKVQKIRENKKSIYVYTGVKNAFVWPKSQMDRETLDTVHALIQKYAPKHR